MDVVGRISNLPSPDKHAVYSHVACRPTSGITRHAVFECDRLRVSILSVRNTEENRPSFHDLTERVKICNFSILSFTHICTLFT